MDEFEQAKIARAIGRNMALRYLVSDLYTEICRTKPDPTAYAEAWRKRSIDAVDALLDGGGDEVLNHTALHEVETFWETVRRGLPPRADTQPRTSGD